MRKFDICIYHGNCTDGFTSAYLVKKKFSDCILFEGNYGQAVPDVKNKHVIIVDFSYPIEQMQQIVASCASVLVIDHHKTSKSNLEGWLPDARIHLDAKASAIFDVTKSGSLLTFEYLNPDVAIPDMISYVNDYDLYKFEYVDTKAVNALITSYDYKIDDYDYLYKNITAPLKGSMYSEARGIMRSHLKNAYYLADRLKRKVELQRHKVWAANVNKLYASEVGNILAKDMPFSITYHDRADGKREISLRSSLGGLDVAEIASCFGGGGHKHAAGFTLNIDNDPIMPYLGD